MSEDVKLPESSTLREQVSANLDMAERFLRRALAAESELAAKDEKIAEQITASCTMQDDIATLVSTHRSDWSWRDVVADVRTQAESLRAVSEALKEKLERFDLTFGHPDDGECDDYGYMQPDTEGEYVEFAFVARLRAIVEGK